MRRWPWETLLWFLGAMVVGVSLSIGFALIAPDQTTADIAGLVIGLPCGFIGWMIGVERDPYWRYR